MTKIRRQIASADLSESDLDREFDFGYACKLITVYIAFSVEVTEDVEIWFDSGDGPQYDTLIADVTLHGARSYVFAAPGDIALDEGDKIKVKVSNANLEGIVSCTVKVEA